VGRIHSYEEREESASKDITIIFYLHHLFSFQISTTVSVLTFVDVNKLLGKKRFGFSIGSFVLSPWQKIFHSVLDAQKVVRAESQHVHWWDTAPFSSV
jgi:hypothetical protein